MCLFFFFNSSLDKQRRIDISLTFTLSLCRICPIVFPTVNCDGSHTKRRKNEFRRICPMVQALLLGSIDSDGNSDRSMDRLFDLRIKRGMIICTPLSYSDSKKIEKDERQGGARKFSPVFPTKKPTHDFKDGFVKWAFLRN